MIQYAILFITAYTMLCDSQCLSHCTPPNDELCRTNCGCSALPSKPQSCLKSCKQICRQLNGLVTTDCLLKCPCTCDQDCLNVCSYYSLDNSCRLNCGCISQIDNRFLELVAIATNKEIIAPNITIPDNFTANETNTSVSTYNTIIKGISECAIAFTAQNEQIAQCITKLAMQKHSLNLLGCTIQCSITTWKSTELFLGCINQCYNESTTVTVNNEVMLIDPYPADFVRLSFSHKLVNLVFTVLFIGAVLFIVLAFINQRVRDQISSKYTKFMYGKKYDYYHKLE